MRDRVNLSLDGWLESPSLVDFRESNSDVVGMSKGMDILGGKMATNQSRLYGSILGL